MCHLVMVIVGLQNITDDMLFLMQHISGKQKACPTKMTTTTMTTKHTVFTKAFKELRRKCKLHMHIITMHSHSKYLMLDPCKLFPYSKMKIYKDLYLF